MSRKRTILLYARSRGGKTTLGAELAEEVMATTGKRTLVYSIDKGGVGPMIPYIELGIIDLVAQEETDPWVFLRMASNGMVRNSLKKWVPADLSQYGLIIFESMTGFGDALMNSLAEKAAQGINIGGAANINFKMTGDDQTVAIGGNNQAHYGICQTRVLDEVWKSQKLDVPFIMWTASASKEDDMNAGGKVLGPQVVGKALTAEMLRHFDLTFRLDCAPAQNGKPETHTLFFGNSIDMASGNAVSLGNTRTPLDASPLPAKLEPASLVKAMKMIDEASSKAKDVIQARMKLSLSKPVAK